MATRSVRTLPPAPAAAATPRRSSFTPPPAELTGFLALPREPEAPSLDACGKRFYMEMDWADHAAPPSNR